MTAPLMKEKHIIYKAINQIHRHGLAEIMIYLIIILSNNYEWKEPL